MTTAPALTATGANFWEIDPPALNKAKSTPSKTSAVSSRTSTGAPWNSSCLPADCAEASKVSWPTGKFRRSSTRIISMPTAPVAPTIAT